MRKLRPAEARWLTQGHAASHPCLLTPVERGSDFRVEGGVLVTQKVSLLAAKKEEAGQQRRMRTKFLWSPSWGFWRGAGGTLCRGVRQLEASFRLEEELALFCPPDTLALYL